MPINLRFDFTNWKLSHYHSSIAILIWIIPWIHWSVQRYLINPRIFNRVLCLNNRRRWLDHEVYGISEQAVNKPGRNLQGYRLRKLNCGPTEITLRTKVKFFLLKEEILFLLKMNFVWITGVSVTYKLSYEVSLALSFGIYIETKQRTLTRFTTITFMNTIPIVYFR